MDWLKGGRIGLVFDDKWHAEAGLWVKEDGC